jgi:hypothetical protein
MILLDWIVTTGAGLPGVDAEKHQRYNQYWCGEAEVRHTWFPFAEKIPPYAYAQTRKWIGVALPIPFAATLPA